MSDNDKRLVEAARKVVADAKKMAPAAYFDSMVARGIIDAAGKLPSKRAKEIVRRVAGRGVS